MKNINYFKLPHATISVVIWLCIWVTLAVLGLTHVLDHDQVSKNAAIIELAVQILIAYQAIKIYKEMDSGKEKKMIFWFFISNLSLFMDDIIFYYFVYIKKISITDMPVYDFLLYYIPFLFWLGALTIFLSKVLLSNILKLKSFIKVVFVFLIANFIMIALFFLSKKEGLSVFAGVTVSQVITCPYKLIMFDMTILCLMCAEDIGMVLLLAGIAILSSSDFLFNYASVAQVDNILVYGELFWFLGLILMLFGLLFIRKNKIYDIKKYFRTMGSIKSRLIFWTFSIAVISFLLFFAFAHFFSLIDEVVFSGLPFFIMIYSVVVVMFSIFMGKHFEAPFKKLALNIEHFMTDNKKTEETFSIDEFSYLQKFLLDMFKVNEEKNRIQKELGTITVQVAHDIRSPLATINAVVKETSEIQEQKRIMLRNATQQLNDIANVLLVKYRSSVDASLTENSSSKESEVIAVLLDLIISEKRLQYKHLPITIEFIVEIDSYGVFAQVVVSDFKRVISNLINNAVEAINGKGNVVIRLSTSENSVDVEIADTGAGMSSELIMKVFNGSIVSSKKEGSGVGLLSSRKLIESWGGKFNITSELNVGTTIHLSFVLLEPATWFVSELSFLAGSRVVILDDDQSIHDLWKSRFSNEISESELQLVHFYRAEDFMNHDLKQLNADYFLCDYELIGQDKTGLDVIEQLNLGSTATLVTSRYDDRDIRNRCAKLGIKILPKNYAAYVSINILPATQKNLLSEHESKKIDLVLIDDNHLVIDTWKFFARLKNKNMLAFDNFEEAERALQNFDRTISIYIDSDLGTDTPGEQYAKILYEAGFTCIYLATGYEADSFEHIYWIKGIVGKTPVF